MLKYSKIYSKIAQEMKKQGKGRTVKSYHKYVKSYVEKLTIVKKAKKYKRYASKTRWDTSVRQFVKSIKPKISTYNVRAYASRQSSQGNKSPDRQIEISTYFNSFLDIEDAYTEGVKLIYEFLANCIGERAKVTAGDWTFLRDIIIKSLHQLKFDADIEILETNLPVGVIGLNDNDKTDWVVKAGARKLERADTVSIKMVDYMSDRLLYECYYKSKSDLEDLDNSEIVRNTKRRYTNFEEGI